MPADTSASITVDNYTSQGNPLIVRFSQPPQRVIAVWQNSVETLLALGLKDRIVAALGVPSSAVISQDYRADYESLPFTQFQLLDTEQALWLQPDFILGWASTFQEKSLRLTTFWNSRGVQTYIAPSSLRQAQPATIQNEYQYILDLGRIFAREERARELVDRMEQKIALVQDATQDRYRPRAVIVEMVRNRFMVYGKDTLAGDILQHVNGDLIDLGKNTNEEALIAADPEVIFLVVSENQYANAEKVRQTLCERPAMQNMAAVRKGRVYVLPLFMVYSSATRTYDGICRVAHGLYPELFDDAD
jgi:iron complex transport system substrate-binding protein